MDHYVRYYTGMWFFTIGFIMRIPAAAHGASWNAWSQREKSRRRER